MSGNLSFTITIISVSLSLIMAIYFLIVPRGNKLSNLLFSITLLVFVALVIHSFMLSAWAYMYFAWYPKLILSLYLSGFLIGPLIFLYVKALITPNFKLQYIHLGHLLPYAIALSFVPVFLKVNGAELRFIISLVVLLHSILYTALLYFWYKEHNNTYEKTVQKLRQTSLYRWLQIIILNYIVLWFISVNTFFIPQFFLRPQWCTYTSSIYLLFFFVFIVSVVFMNLLQPSMLDIKLRNKSTSLNEDHRREYNRICNYIQNQKAYRDPDLTLQMVSNALNIHTRVVSNVISEYQKQHFNAYVNSLRIEESKQLLREVNGNQKTILEILYEVGFNSKSAFNHSFKRNVGLTPTEFRNIMIMN